MWNLHLRRKSGELRPYEYPKQNCSFYVVFTTMYLRFRSGIRNAEDQGTKALRQDSGGTLLRPDRKRTYTPVYLLLTPWGRSSDRHGLHAHVGRVWDVGLGGTWTYVRVLTRSVLVVPLVGRLGVSVLLNYLVVKDSVLQNSSKQYIVSD